MPTEPNSELRTYAEFAPPFHARDAVVCLWRSTPGDQARQITVLPDGCIDLIWQTGREPFIAGPMTVPGPATTPPGVTTLGVRFAPGSAAGLLHVSAAELRDARVPLHDLWPGGRPSRARDLSLAVQDTLSLDDAVAAVDALLRAGAPRDRLIADACDWFVRRPGEPVAAFIAGNGLGERQLRRRFQDHVGFGPKTLQRILRMQRVLWLMSLPGPPRSLAYLALAAGYADQAHLTRETQALAGQRPTRLITGSPQSAVADLFKTPPA